MLAPVVAAMTAASSSGLTPASRKATATARYMAPDKPFTPEITARVYDEIFRYFEPAVLQRFSLSVRRFLLDLAPFQSFDLDMAKVITGNVRAGELLDWLQRNTTMLLYDGVPRAHL